MSNLNLHLSESSRPNVDSTCTSGPGDSLSTTWAQNSNLPSFGEAFGPSAGRNLLENQINRYPLYNPYSSGLYSPAPAAVPSTLIPYPHLIAFLGSQAAYMHPPIVNNIPSPAHSEEDLPPAHEISSRLHTLPSSCLTQSMTKKNPKGRRKQVDKENEPHTHSTKRKADGPPGDAPAIKKQRGCTSGSGNYTNNDLLKLFDLLESYLPLGGKAWNEVSDYYNEWAKKEGHPIHQAKSLENKFKQLVKTTKPTGDAEIPWRVSKALEINDLMNEKAGTRDLDDDEIDDCNDEVIEISNDEGDSDSQDPPKKEVIKTMIKTEKVPIARRPTTAPAQQRRNAGQDLLNSINNAMSPEAQLLCSQNHAAQTFQMTQLLSLNSCIRDLERTNENLRCELTTAERCTDRLKLRLELSSSLHHDLPQHKHHGHRTIMHKVEYPEGGYSTQVYHSDDLTPLDLDSMNGLNDEPGTKRTVIYDSEEDGKVDEDSKSESYLRRSYEV